MADRIITIDLLDVVSGEKIRLVYNADTKALTLEEISQYDEGQSGEVVKSAYKVTVVSDE